MATKPRFPETVGVRLRSDQKEVLVKAADDLDLGAGALGRRYIINGLRRDGVEI